MAKVEVSIGSHALSQPSKLMLGQMTPKEIYFGNTKLTSDSIIIKFNNVNCYVQNESIGYFMYIQIHEFTKASGYVTLDISFNGGGTLYSGTYQGGMGYEVSFMNPETGKAVGSFTITFFCSSGMNFSTSSIDSAWSDGNVQLIDYSGLRVKVKIPLTAWDIPNVTEEVFSCRWGINENDYSIDGYEYFEE